MRFNDDWVPYAHRGAWLLQADCAVAAHHDHLETRFAHRTRLLDCLWAGLPVVCTRGDELAERIERDDLGATVASRRIPRALAAALDARARPRARRLRGPARRRRGRASVVAGGGAARAAGGGARGELPLGARAGRRRPRSPALRGRDAAYVAARSVLNGVGRRDWPRVR